MASSSNDVQRGHSIGEIENWNIDRSVDPPTRVVGIMKKSGGAWAYWDGTIVTTQAPLSADGSSISAIQEGANRLRISAFQGDAALLRISSLAASLDATNSVDKVEQQFSYSNITGPGITTIKTGAAFLHSVVINTRGTGSTLKAYDSTSTNNLFATIDTTLSTTAFVYDCKLSAGLTVSAAGAGNADLTITYR